MLASIGYAYGRGAEYRLGLWYWLAGPSRARVPVTYL